MNQINVNPSREPVDVVDTSGDRSAAAGINLITVLIVLAVLAVIVWYLFTGPLHAITGGGSTNINVNTPPSTGQVNQSSQPNAPAPSNGNTTSSSSSTTGGTGSTGSGSAGTTGGTGASGSA